VVRDDPGVGIILGSIDGDRGEARKVDTSGWGGVSGIGGAFWRTDNRFARRASVGLTVLAPSPLACEFEGGIPGITDIRFAEDDGVVVPRPFGLPGDLPANDEDLLCSGVLVFATGVKCVCPCLEGGWSDFVFAARDAVNPRGPSV
jgi:hypothetical protein